MAHFIDFIGKGVHIFGDRGMSLSFSHAGLKDDLTKPRRQ